MPEQKLNILIVDDHEDTVMMFHARLTREGHEAIGLTDLARVDDALSKHPVDVLLIDSYLTKPVDWDILRGLLQNVRAA